MIPTACLPATGSDNTTLIVVAVALAALLLTAGIIAVTKSKGRIALLMLPVVALALVLGGAPAKSAQAVETAYAGFTIPGWTYEPGEDGPADDLYVSDAASAEQEVTLTALEDMNTAGTATRTTVVTVQSDDLSESVTLDGSSWFFLGVDFQTAVFYDDFWTGVDELEDEIGNLPLTVTHTYDYKDSCGKPLQTVVVYTGTIANIPVP